MLNGSYATIVGNAVADFDLRFTPNGVAVGDVTIAVNSRIMDDGEWVDRESPMFVQVTVWREPAENCAETITKGDRLIAVGELYVRNWETREGEQRLSIEMTADEIGPALRFAQAKVTRMGRTDRDDDRDDDRGRGRGDRGNRRGSDDRGRGSGGRGGSRQRPTSDRGSASARRGSSGRGDDRDDDRRGGGRTRDDRGSARRGGGGRSSQDVWDSDSRDDDRTSDLPDDPDF
jgi:single-strand DNA-binding protein